MNAPPREVPRIVVSMVVVCALGAAVLGGVYVATERYQREQARRSERSAIVEMLSLDSTASVIEVRQYLSRARSRVIYRAAALGSEGEARQFVFSLAGALESEGNVAAEKDDPSDPLTPLGKLFVARQQGRDAGYVLEGTTQGYKNRIRFLVALDSGFSIAGVRVIEHEEDPGLGAEIATPQFQGQFAGRTPEQTSALDVTRDPMPEDWRSALAELGRTPVARWRAAHGAISAREAAHPIYAVTGATISSRALTDGVRNATEHFRRRWLLLGPHLGGTS